MFNSSTWTITPEYQTGNRLKAFASIDHVFNLRGKQINDDKLSSVHRVEIDGVGYYVKRYIKAGKGIRRYLGRSRIRAEWENMLFFHELGVPAAKVVAYGEEKKFGVMTRGVLITEEVKNSKDLKTMVNESSPKLSDRAWMKQVINQVATIARKLHDKKFVHIDFKWRNILVTQTDHPEVFLIDCPSGTIVSALLFERGRVKDLACLDKVAKTILSSTDRLSFFFRYCNLKNIK
ncbi:lipopolysaccharide kinase InaA family protein [Endozoicomonas lisbonensis]|uniref:lipopolysaccharide kinase InaA family protein n=1 Tax=Endozoicomonas lisbonensis TaxID=3120522 RepID=UPI0033933654